MYYKDTQLLVNLSLDEVEVPAVKSYNKERDCLKHFHSFFNSADNLKN